MRVLIVHNYYKQGGGEDTVFEQEVNLLRENGCLVEALIFDNENFTGKFIDDTRSAILALYNTESGKRLDRAIALFQPDIIHIHNLFYTASASVIRTAKKRGVPVVMTLHNYRLVCINGLLMREGKIPCETCLTQMVPVAGIQNACFQHSKAKSAHLTAITLLHKLTGIWKQVDRFIVVTDFTRQKILRSSLKLATGQVCVKPNFVADAGYTSPQERDDFFLFVGRLSFEKGIHILLKAARTNGFPLTIIGDGPMAADVLSMSENVSTIDYKGKQSREVVLNALKRCRALIVPSLCYEGLPTVILEAFSSGTPVICSDHQSFSEIVEDGTTGLLFQTGNSFALGEIVSTFRQDITREDRLSQNAYLNYQTRYTKEIALQATLDLYRELVNK